MSTKDQTSNRYHKPLPSKRVVVFWFVAMLIAVELVTVFSVVALYQIRMNDALAVHSQRLLSQSVKQAEENTRAYLKQVQQTLLVTGALLGANPKPLFTHDGIESLFIQQLKIDPKLDGMFLATPKGDFSLLMRVDTQTNSSARGYLFKQISLTSEPKVWIRRRDADLRVVQSINAAPDAFDPRLSSWYQDAVSSSQLIWTDPDQVHGSGASGLTVATSLKNSDGALLAVLGAEVRLSTLSRFLSSQALAIDGEAIVLHRDGSLIAHRALNDFETGGSDSGPRLTGVNQLDTPARDGIREFRHEGVEIEKIAHPVHISFESAHVSYLGTFRPFLNQSSWPWLIGAFIPESRLVGDLRDDLGKCVLITLLLATLITLAAYLIGMRLIRPYLPGHDLANVDTLTGLRTRAWFEQHGPLLLIDHDRHGRCVSLALMEVDDFSTHSRLTASILDELLGLLARRIQGEVGNDDLLARFGDRTFAVLLPNTDLSSAMGIISRICSSISRYPVSTSVGLVEISLSAGISEHQHGSLNDLVANADRALLQSRGLGTGRVSTWPESEVAPS